MTVESTNRLAEVDDVWTVRQVLGWTIAHLKKHGSQSPRLDSEVLLAYARGCQRIELYTHFDDSLTNDERTVMRQLVQRRAQAEPVAYLVGHREFFGLDFRVTPNVLIPRPETETLVMEVLQIVEDFPEPRILDVGTGSGCVAISIAVNQPRAQVTASDVSKAALQVARKNADGHAVAERIQFLLGDLFAPMTSDQQFHIVASNPPYVTESEIGTLPADIRLHEPRPALDGGSDGLVVLRRLIEQAPTHLIDSGYLIFEISDGQGTRVCDLLNANGSYTDIEVVKDLAGQSRVVRALKVS